MAHEGDAYLTPREHTRRRQRRLAAALAGAVGLLVVSLADHWLWRALKVESNLNVHDWYQLLRQAGYLPLWLVVAAALWFHDRAGRRGRLLALSALGGGGAAELLKLLVQRLRPGQTGEYLFGWSLRGLETPGAHALLGTGNGTASSHAGVAFGAAFMLSYLFPGARPVFMSVAVACGVTRLMAGAHFASDVYSAALMSYAVFVGLRGLDRVRRARAQGATRETALRG